jgi:septum formation protein
MEKRMNEAVRELVLASSSRYRAQLLARLELPFASHPANLDERPGVGESAHALVQRLSREKAERVALDHPAALVIGSDQCALCNDRILGKPGDAPRAREQLAMLSGNAVQFLTGLCLLDARAGTAQATVVITTVRFRDLRAAQIADYVAREQPFDCAGAFKSEGLGIALFESIDGDDPNALVGLPLIALCSMLERAGLPVLGGSAG